MSYVWQLMTGGKLPSRKHGGMAKCSVALLYVSILIKSQGNLGRIFYRK